MLSRSSISFYGAITLYIAALMGPSLMVIPGLAVDAAGPASLFAWLLLIGLSAAFAYIFAKLGVTIHQGGIANYARLGLGELAAKTITWCFISGILVGIPYVSLIGGTYFSHLLGWRRPGTAFFAAVIIAIILALSASGTRIGMRIHMTLVICLLATVLVAGIGVLPQAQASNWQPFAPHGLMAIGRAASLVVMGFVGWEAIAPLIELMDRPEKLLPAVITTAFITTNVIYLLVVIATISVLGETPGSASLAVLLNRVLGTAGPMVAALVAGFLVIAASYAYLAGTLETIMLTFPKHKKQARTYLYAFVIIINAATFACFALGLIDLEFTIQFPAALSLAIYIICTLSAARIFSGLTRLISIVGACVSLLVFAFTGYAMLVPLGIALLMFLLAYRSRAKSIAHHVHDKHLTH